MCFTLRREALKRSGSRYYDRERLLANGDRREREIVMDTTLGAPYL